MSKALRLRNFTTNNVNLQRTIKQGLDQFLLWDSNDKNLDVELKEETKEQI